MKKNYSPTEANPLFHLTKAVIPLLIILFVLLVSCIEEPLEDPLSVSSNQAPSISCPADIMQVVATGAVPAVVEWAELPTVIDPDEDGGALASAAIANPEPGSMFEAGATTVTYTITDNAGVTDTCTFTVTVTEDAAPTLSACPVDIIRVANTGERATEVDWVSPTATDNEDDNNNNAAVTMEANYNPGDTFPVGETEVTYTARDSRGQEDACTFTVTVNANIPPSITCPVDIVEVVNAGVPAAQVTWTVPTGSDTEDNENVLMVDSTHQPNTEFSVGSTTVTYTVRDSNDGITECAFMVRVTENTVPTLSTCPVDIVAVANTGVGAAQVDWVAPTATDNEDDINNDATVTVEADYNSGDAFPVGKTEVTYTATDSQGQAVMCSFMVTVNENTEPSITCPADIVEVIDSGLTGIAVTWMDPVVTDIEDDVNGPSLSVAPTSGHTSGSTFQVGTTSSVTYTVTDSNSGTDSCTFKVVVTDVAFPTISDCPSNIIVVADTGSNTALATWTAPTATNADDSTSSLTTTHEPGTDFNVGNTVVTYTATDNLQQMSVCSFTVMVNENNLPTITCPADVVEVVPTGIPGASVTWAIPTVSDTEDDDDTLIVNSRRQPNHGFALGSEAVTYTVTDSNNGMAECTFMVEVREDMLPVLSECPEDMVGVINTGKIAVLVHWTSPTATDHEDDSNNGETVFVNANYNSGHAFPLGTTEVIYTAIDSRGQKDTCSFMVSVSENTLPVITCSGNIERDLSGMADDVVTVSVTWAAPVVSDIEDDAAGITLTPTGTAWEDTENSRDLTDFGGVFPIGRTIVVYVVEDSNKGMNNCSFFVIVTKDNPPMFTDCPGDISQAILTEGGNTLEVTWDVPTAIDGDGNTISADSISSNFSPGSEFSLGQTTQVTYTATDSNSISATCSFNVIISDNYAPVFARCPEDMVVGVATLTDNEAVARWNNPIVRDEENTFGMLTKMASYSTEDGAPSMLPFVNRTNQQTSRTFGLGVTTVTYHVTDTDSHTATCSFMVTVTDDSPIFENCPEDMSKTVLAADVASTTFTWAPPTASDKTDGPFTSSQIMNAASQQPGTVFPVGETTVTYTLMDSAEYVGTCSFTVTLIENRPPRFNNCPNDITHYRSASARISSLPAQGVWIAPTPTDTEDNNRDLDVTFSHSSGTFFEPGNTDVIYTVTDSHGATGTCSFVVSVLLNYPAIELVDSEDERIIITEAYAFSDTVTIVEIYIEKAPPLPSDLEVGSSSRFITLDRIAIRSPATRPGETDSYRDLYTFNYSLVPNAETNRFYEGSFYVFAFANHVNFFEEGANVQVAWPDGLPEYALPTIEGDCVAIELVLLNEQDVYETQDFVQAGNECDLDRRGLSWDESSGTLPAPVRGQSLARSLRPSDEEAGFQQSIGTFHASEWEITPTHTSGHPPDANCIIGRNVVDVDEDGIPDCLEASGETYFGMSFYDWGARTSQKDIFVEVDYMPCLITGDLRSQPDKEAFERIRDQFNTYSQGGTNLVLHMDVGDLFGENINTGFNLGGGNSIITNEAERSNYWGITLTRSEEEGARRFHQTKQANFSPVRKHFFHYMLFAETDDPAGGEGDTLGIAELGGNDSLMTMGGGGAEELAKVGLNLYSGCDINSPTQSGDLAEVAKNYFQNNQAYTVMHELGHNLGLSHGGGENDQKNYEPNYFSVMNYLYAVHGPPDRENQSNTRKRVRDAYYYRHRTSEANTNCLRRFDDELDGLPTRGSNFTGFNNNGQRLYGESQELHLFYRDLDDFDLHFSTGGNSNLNENRVDESNLFDISPSNGGSWSMPLDIDCDGATNTALTNDVNFDETNSNNLNDHNDVDNISSFFANPFGDRAPQSSTSARVRLAASAAGKEPELQVRMRRQRKPFNDIQPVVSAEEEARPEMRKVDLSSSATLDQNRHDHDHDHDHGHGHK